MQVVNRTQLLTTVALSAAACLAAAQDLPTGAVRFTPTELKWKASPRVPGLENAEMIGDSTKPGPYVNRVKFPANFMIQAHSHPEDRTYTIISGTWYIGWGEKYEPAKLTALPPGSFYTEPANVPHFVATKNEPVVVQISGTGPTGVKYVDPAHEPKK